MTIYVWKLNNFGVWTDKHTFTHKHTQTRTHIHTLHSIVLIFSKRNCVKINYKIILFVSDGLSTGAIVGIVIGSVAVLVLIGGFAFLIVRYTKSK
jgi:hypothetical protein